MPDSSTLAATAIQLLNFDWAPPSPMLNLFKQFQPNFKVFDKRSENSLHADLVNVVQKLDGVIQDNGLINPNFSFAVVDLTDDTGITDISDMGSKKPAYAGLNDTTQLNIDSTGKLLPLYGAYQLRRDLRLLASKLNIHDLATLAEVTRKVYRSLHAGFVSSSDATPVPLIEELFKINSTTIQDGPDFLDFQKSTYEYDDKSLLGEFALISLRRDRTAPNKKSKLHDHNILARELDDNPQEHRFPFREQLRLMAGWSDDVAASIVMRSLGFPFLWVLANRSGLYKTKWPKIYTKDPDRRISGGLTHYNDYNYGRPYEKKSLLKGLPRGLSHGGTARSVATLMTMLFKENDIINQEAQFGMRQMLCNVAEFDNAFLETENDPDPKKRIINYRGESSNIAGRLIPYATGIRNVYEDTISSENKVIDQKVWIDSSKTIDEYSQELQLTAEKQNNLEKNAIISLWSKLTDQQKIELSDKIAASKVGYYSSSKGSSSSNAVLIRAGRQRQIGRNPEDIKLAYVLVGINTKNDDSTLLEKFGEEMAKKLDMRHGMLSIE